MTGSHLQREFEILLTEHRRLVMKVAAMYTRSAEDRRDLEQDICVQLWRTFSSYDPSRAKFSTWMYRVALNVAISQFRRPGRSLQPHQPLDEHHGINVARDDPSLEGDARIAALYAFIGQLEPLNRALILLHLEERSYAEIAEILGISETNVATKISRIKNLLRSKAKSHSVEGD